MNAPLSNIPTHLIAGPLGVGKTSLVSHLLTQKPPDQRWAVLVNEFGQVGLDAALLANGGDGIAIGEVAGGCMCCVNGAPFQVALARLLRTARPHRLFIEASGLGHPLPLLRQLRQPPWVGVLAVQPLVVLAPAPGGAQPDEACGDAYAAAGLIVVTQADRASPAELATAMQRWRGRPVVCVSHGRLNIDALPVAALEPVDNSPGLPFSLAVDAGRPTLPRVQASHQGQHWSIGWQWPAATMIDEHALAACLRGWPWLRAKAVIHGRAGWLGLNAAEGHPLDWRPSEWRRDNRLELIFGNAQPQGPLQAAVENCLLAHG